MKPKNLLWLAGCLIAVSLSPRAAYGVPVCNMDVFHIDDCDGNADGKVTIEFAAGKTWDISFGQAEYGTEGMMPNREFKFCNPRYRIETSANNTADICYNDRFTLYAQTPAGMTDIIHREEWSANRTQAPGLVRFRDWVYSALYGPYA